MIRLRRFGRILSLDTLREMFEGRQVMDTTKFIPDCIDGSAVAIDLLNLTSII
jgi:hypothetical protein